MTTLEKDIKEAATSAGKDAPKVLQVKLEVTSQESVDAAAATVEKEFGKLDILVNNAGILGQYAPVADTDPEQWWQTWNVNLRGPYLITRAFLPLMLKGGDKQLVTVSSVGAHAVTSGLSAYQPSKLGVLRFMEFVAAEYGEKGVLAFCIHPGNIPTDIIGGIEGVPDNMKHGEWSCRCSMMLGRKLIVDSVRRNARAAGGRDCFPH